MEVIEDDEIDYEEYGDDESTKPDDFIGIISYGFGSINFKHLIFMLIMFIFLSSDVYVDRVLSKIPGTVFNRSPNTKGTMIQLMFFAIAYILIDILVSYKIL